MLSGLAFVPNVTPAPILNIPVAFTKILLLTVTAPAGPMSVDSAPPMPPVTGFAAAVQAVAAPVIVQVVDVCAVIS